MQKAEVVNKKHNLNTGRLFYYTYCYTMMLLI